MPHHPMDKIYCPKDRVIYREIADEALLVPVHGDVADMRSLFSLNLVARHVWLQLDGRRPLSEVIDDVCERFDVERADADRDLGTFVRDLLDADLIVEV